MSMIDSMNSSTVTLTPPQEAFLEKLFDVHGQFMSVEWGRPAKLRAKYKNMDVKKHVHGVFRAGVNYDNKASVQEKRENGELPAENAGLPWGEWLKPPYLVSHKGNIYVRLYPTPNCKVESYFTIDGERVSDEEIFGRYVISRYEGKKLVVINDNARIYETKGENLLVAEVKPAIVTAAEYPRDETPECITVRLDHIVC